MFLALSVCIQNNSKVVPLCYFTRTLNNRQVSVSVNDNNSSGLRLN